MGSTSNGTPIASSRIHRCLAHAGRVLHPMGLNGEEDALLDEFLQWATAHGALNLDQVKISYLQKGGVLVRSLVAAKEVACPILLPRQLLLAADSAEALARKLALERSRLQLGDETFWAPWLRILPDEAELAEYHVAYAPEPVLHAFHALPVVARVQAWRQQMRQSFAEASEQPLAWEEFFWAATVVQTRVYVPPPSFCFMPVADMMNTGPQPNMEVFDSLEYDGADGHFYGLLGAVPQHAELVQAYQPVDNSERLFRCGFLYSENPVRVAPLPEEVCREMLAAEVEGPKPLLASLRALTLEHLQEGLHCREGPVAG
ncbi:unnamed protein product [Effrenium voratum]|nr:unnamed protein product [Effrenium voratum]